MVADDTEEIVDVDAAVDEELAEAEQESAEEGEPKRAPREYESNLVTYADREFEIEEPDIGIVLRILKVFGRLAQKGERSAIRELQSIARNPHVSSRMALWGMLSEFSKEDLIALGSAVLQFEDDKAGREWLGSYKLRLAPIIRAFFLNLSQSDDLRDAIDDFFVGLEMTQGFLESLRL